MGGGTIGSLQFQFEDSKTFFSWVYEKCQKLNIKYTVLQQWNIGYQNSSRHWHFLKSHVPQYIHSSVVIIRGTARRLKLCSNRFFYVEVLLVKCRFKYWSKQKNIDCLQRHLTTGNRILHTSFFLYSDKLADNSITCLHFVNLYSVS